VTRRADRPWADRVRRRAGQHLRADGGADAGPCGCSRSENPFECVVIGDHDVECWGHNDAGQLGTPDGEDHADLKAVAITCPAT
jgi:hypothetical protein